MSAVLKCLRLPLSKAALGHVMLTRNAPRQRRRRLVTASNTARSAGIRLATHHAAVLRAARRATRRRTRATTVNARPALACWNAEQRNVWPGACTLGTGTGARQRSPKSGTGPICVVPRTRVLADQEPSGGRPRRVARHCRQVCRCSADNGGSWLGRCASALGSRLPSCRIPLSIGRC